MEEGSTKVNNIVARVMVLRRYAHLLFFFGSFYFIVTFISTSLSMLCFSTSNCLDLLGAQSDEQCCNSCEEVREAYKKKGWALTNPDLIDQVPILPGFIHHDGLHLAFLWENLTFKLMVHN